MILTNTDPYEQGRIDGHLAEISRNGFEIVRSEQFPGYCFYTRCKSCGHELKVNQHIWRLRHAMKCENR